MNANNNAGSALSRKPATCPQHLRSFAVPFTAPAHEPKRTTVSAAKVPRLSQRRNRCLMRGSYRDLPMRPETNQECNHE